MKSNSFFSRDNALQNPPRYTSYQNSLYPKDICEQEEEKRATRWVVTMSGTIIHLQKKVSHIYSTSPNDSWNSHFWDWQHHSWEMTKWNQTWGQRAMEAVEAVEQEKSKGRMINQREGREKKPQLHNIFLYISVIVSNCKTEISVAPNGVTWSTSNFQCIQLERGIERCILHLSTLINSGSVRDFLSDEVTPMLCLY